MLHYGGIQIPFGFDHNGIIFFAVKDSALNGDSPGGNGIFPLDGVPVHGHVADGGPPGRIIRKSQGYGQAYIIVCHVGAQGWSLRAGRFRKYFNAIDPLDIVFVANQILFSLSEKQPGRVVIVDLVEIQLVLILKLPGF